MFLFFEQIIQRNYLRKAIFEIILSRKLQRLLISQLVSEGLKEFLGKRISAFPLIINKFEVRLYDPGTPLIK